MMKKTAGFLFAFLLAAIIAGSQDIDSIIARYANEYGQERIYLQYDKSAYAPGETVWFKAFLMEGLSPAEESKTIYVDWTDAAGNLLLHTVAPIVDAGSNGQFEIPARYSGKFIHVKAYTKWMLNFDSAFLYEKDIRVIINNNKNPVNKVAIETTLNFFPEGGDLAAGVVNKVAFKASDQWGRPVIIKGIVQNSKNEKIDSLRILHDGMGYFFIAPQLEESYSVRWKDEMDIEHITVLPRINPAGIALQLTVSGKKRTFSITADSAVAKKIGRIHIIGTAYQYQAFKVTKDISKGSVTGTIPTQDLPSGILTITVFDEKWNPLAERITYVNNDEYRFNAEMTVEHWGLNKRARNEIQIKVPDSLEANFAVSVTDAGIESDSSDNIISHLLLANDLKGRINNPAYYFSGNNDTIAKHLDLVMLTHGWRRFKWDDVVKGKMPRIIYPKDSSYLSFAGKVYGATPAQLRDDPNIILIVNQKKAGGENKMLVLPVEADGSFTDSSLVLFDTAHVFYQLSKNLGDASVKFMEGRLLPLRNRMAASGFYYNRVGDTTGYSRHFELSEATLKLLQQAEGKTLENVTVKSRTKSSIEIMDEKYSSGLFAGADSYKFDLVNDRTAFSARNIFEYLQAKVPGLQISTATLPPTMRWRGGEPQLYLNEMPVDAGFVSSLSVSQLAYIKVFRPPFFGGSGNSAFGGIAIYTRQGGDLATEPGKGLANNMVIGYTQVREFYSPVYPGYKPSSENEDLRTTLYWNPLVSTTPLKNTVKLSFYNNDVSKSFRVVIEGITRNGQLVHIEQIMD